MATSGSSFTPTPLGHEDNLEVSLNPKVNALGVWKRLLPDTATFVPVKLDGRRSRILTDLSLEIVHIREKDSGIYFCFADSRVLAKYAVDVVKKEPHRYGTGGLKERAREFGKKTNSGTCLSGVPQGSVLSSYLYNIYTHDFPQHSTFSTCLFADDSAVLSQGVQLKYTMKAIQNFPDNLEIWLTHLRIAINVDKSQAIIFRKWGVIDPPFHLTLFDDNIQWVSAVKYLGLHIDSRLTFKKHIDYLADKFRGRIHSAISLIGRRSPLSLENKGLGTNPGKDMDVCKCIVLSWQGDTINSRRAASPLVKLVEGEESFKKVLHKTKCLTSGIILHLKKGITNGCNGRHNTGSQDLFCIPSSRQIPFRMISKSIRPSIPIPAYTMKPPCLKFDLS
ncbi:RNA-directed DNA polymerase from mobile element jockey [Trichonephila clavipes]|uniref:RNA-directed DNA polymerase from mobile element jockey n=1 Tax=Trichonephila clavipes TaxID=2585209 RepID=A0A8X6SPM3_TRICX|nr:RNA-directed DNA polymerase from mobile element jockey [Trichonephila clavipes]